MKNFILKILDLFRGLFHLLKVDYEQLRAIVSIKLTMDNRRQTISYKRKGKEETKNAFIWSTLAYSLFGIFIAITLYRLSFMFGMTLFFSYVMVMIAMTLITDFSSILLDTSDNTIILPRPVDGRTLFVARITHVFIYLSQLTFALSIIPGIVVIIQYGFLFFLFFCVAIVLSVITAVFLTNAVYLLIMQFSSEEKLKNMINYFQIVMAVVVMGGYQLLPRLMNRFDLENSVFDIKWWGFLTPPVWMAGALESLHIKMIDGTHLTLIVLAIVVPPVGMFIINRFLTPVFSRKLGVMGSSSDQPIVEQGRSKRNEKFLDAITSKITFNPYEYGSFKLIYKILGRDRKIKLKIYPALGYVLIFGVVFMSRSHEDFSTAWNNLPYTKYFVALIYFTFMVSQVALREIIYSDEFKAGWIYFSAPVDKPGEILSGMLKAIFVKLFVPVYVFITALVIFIWGITVIDDVIFGLVNNFIILLCMAMIGNKHLPLSMAPSVRDQSGNFVRSMLMLFLIGVPGLLHWALTNLTYGVLICLPFQIMLCYFMLRSYKSTAWSEIKS